MPTVLAFQAGRHRPSSATAQERARTQEGLDREHRGRYIGIENWLIGKLCMAAGIFMAAAD